MALRAISDQISTNTTSMVVTKPTGAIEGDRVWVFFHLGGEFGTAWTIPSGWTNFYTAGSKRLYSKLLGAGEAATWTWTWTGAMEFVFARALAYDEWARYSRQSSMAQQYTDGTSVGHSDGSYRGSADPTGTWTSGPTQIDPGDVETRFPYLRCSVSAKRSAVSYPAYPTQSTHSTWRQHDTYNAQIAPADNLYGEYMAYTFDTWDLLSHDEEGEPTQLFFSSIVSGDPPFKNTAWGSWGNAPSSSNLVYVPLADEVVDDEGGDEGFDEWWDVLHGAGADNDADVGDAHHETHEEGGGDFVAGAWAHVYTNGAASTTWVITHDLGGYPSVALVDATGETMEGNVVYDSTSQITVTFESAQDGEAYLT